MQSKDFKTKIKNANKPRLIGFGLVLFGVIILISIYLPILISYFSFLVRGDVDSSTVEEIQEVTVSADNNSNEDIPHSIIDLFPDSQYSLFIPKIDAEAKIVPEIDPFNEAEYSAALKDGVAQANTSVHPGEGGNTFLFAHSAMNFYELISENVNFYLLTKLEEGDSVFTMYEGDIYEYEVVNNQIVDPAKIEYLDSESVDETLTLMTCWPAGTDYKRVVVVAERK